MSIATSIQSRFVIRAANESDCEAIVEITNAAYIVEHDIVVGDRTDIRQIQTSMASGCFFVVLDREQADTVCASIYCKPNLPRAYFGLLAVKPSYQGHGLAKSLIDYVSAYCRDRGCSFLDISVISVRHELFAFYHRLGFASFDTMPFHSPDMQRKPFKLICMTKALRDDSEL